MKLIWKTDKWTNKGKNKNNKSNSDFYDISYCPYMCQFQETSLDIS